MATAAELLRQKMAPSAQPATQQVDTAAVAPLLTSSSGADLDDEIRRLEAELAQDDDDESDDESSSDESEDDYKDAHPAGSEGVLNLSQLNEARIESLPPTALPAPGGGGTRTKNSKRALDEQHDNNNSNNEKKKKSKRTKTATNELPVSAGLKSAVEELLRGYQPRSAERLPFYCRVCAQQYDNEDAFLQHKQQEFHQAAVTLERKATYCKLCRKQLTSPVQLQEHLRSRPHKERLDWVQAKQRGGGGGGRPPAHGNGAQNNTTSRQPPQHSSRPPSQPRGGGGRPRPQFSSSNRQQRK